MYRTVLEGERGLLGALGANTALGSVQLIPNIAGIESHLPGVLVFVQVLVGLATLVYLIVKIEKALEKPGTIPSEVRLAIPKIESAVPKIESAIAEIKRAHKKIEAVLKKKVK